MLIIYAHPSKSSHCGIILNETKSFLKENDVSFSVLDLYKVNFNPVLSVDEYNDLISKSDYSKDKKNILSFQKLIKDNDEFIFIYPIWWNSPPAILKGFFDRVFNRGFAFKYVNGVPKKLLSGKRALILSTSGSNNFIYKFFLRSRGSKLLADNILDFCGIKTKYANLASCKKINDDKKAEIKTFVRKSLKIILP